MAGGLGRRISPEFVIFWGFISTVQLRLLLLSLTAATQGSPGPVGGCLRLPPPRLTLGEFRAEGGKPHLLGRARRFGGETAK